jgi:hypothetical protein
MNFSPRPAQSIPTEYHKHSHILFKSTHCLYSHLKLCDKKCQSCKSIRLFIECKNKESNTISKSTIESRLSNISTELPWLILRHKLYRHTHTHTLFSTHKTFIYISTEFHPHVPFQNPNTDTSISIYRRVSQLRGLSGWLAGFEK